MKENQSKLRQAELLPTAKVYLAPEIEIINIEMEQNFFAGSNGPLPEMPGEIW